MSQPFIMVEPMEPYGQLWPKTLDDDVTIEPYHKKRRWGKDEQRLHLDYWKPIVYRPTCPTCGGVLTWLCPECKDNYTHEEYLATWEEHFGDEVTGEVTSWHHGVSRQNIIFRLSRGQFQHSLALVERNGRWLDKELKKPFEDQDGQWMDRLFAESFPHELLLFM